MNRREQVLALVAGQKPDVIPTVHDHDSFMDVTVHRALAGKPTGDAVKDEIAVAELVKKNNVVVDAHMKARTIEEDDQHHIYEYENGARWEMKYKPTFCRESLKLPVNSLDDIDKLTFPDMRDQSRYGEIERQITEFKKTDFLIQGCMGGIWSGSYYFCTSFDNILLWMGMCPDAAHKIFAKTAEYVLTRSEELLKRGIDVMSIYDDLGTGTSPLFSPEMYREFIKPWHKKLADLCHSYGKLLHMHSHGHIQILMDDIVDAGIDILNPVGPSDRNDLSYFKKEWGDKITFNGGISTTISSMSEEEMEKHISEVMEAGCKGGRFMPRTESCIPPMLPEKLKFYIDTLYKYRVQYGSK